MFLDYIEIGTSDFDTFAQRAKGDITGLSIEPIAIYLDVLPNSEQRRKINAAVTDYDGAIDTFFIHPEQITKHNLPNWLRGCNSVGAPHPSAVQYLNKSNPELTIVKKTVPAYKLTTILNQESISDFYYLKVDTEGHEATILDNFLSEAPQELLPHVIAFETNRLSDRSRIQSTLIRLLQRGYDLERSDFLSGDGETIVRKNLKFHEAKQNFTEAIPNYLLEEYFPNYDPTNPPHKNTLADAMDFCSKNKCTGISFFNNRYEVRNGKYLIPGLPFTKRLFDTSRQELAPKRSLAQKALKKFLRVIRNTGGDTTTKTTENEPNPTLTWLLR